MSTAGKEREKNQKSCPKRKVLKLAVVVETVCPAKGIQRAAQQKEEELKIQHTPLRTKLAN
jgi:hypothetical protein